PGSPGLRPGEIITTGLPRSMVRWMPLVVVYSRVVALPALIGMRRITLPSLRTTMVWVLTLTVLIQAAPMRRVWLTFFTPQVPGPERTPAMRAVKRTFWWAGQKREVR